MATPPPRRAPASTAAALAAREAQRHAGVARDAGQAATLYARACDAGSDLGCALAASARLLCRGAGRDDPATLDALERSCRNGGAETCALAGWAHQHGRGAAANTVRGDEFYAQGCARGIGGGQVRSQVMAVSGSAGAS